MSAIITVHDESTTGTILSTFEFEVPSETITVHELIRSRVYQEVKDFHSKQAAEPAIRYNGLIVPTENETILNGDRTSRTLDWQRQFERALDAFRRGQILILVDQRQLTSLDDEITVTAQTSVSFLRLTILTGG